MNDDESGRIDFLVGLSNDLASRIQVPRGEPPPVPESTSVDPDSVLDYMTLADNPTYGATGLMTVQPWTSKYGYGDVEPGTVFLFPGTYDLAPEPYNGTVMLNGTPHKPLTNPGHTKDPLHQQLCTALGTTPESFVGFGIRRFPYDKEGNFVDKSNVCNPYWFDGKDRLPLSWVILVRTTLRTGLPGPELGMESIPFKIGPTTGATVTASILTNPPPGASRAEVMLAGFDLGYVDSKQYRFAHQTVQLSMGLGIEAVQCSVTLEDSGDGGHAWQGTVDALVLYFTT